MDKAAEAGAAHPVVGYKASWLSDEGAETALAHGFMVLTHARPPLKI